ncbi:MAG: hypothetical protein BMS9Abin37_1148 [Acidobacteriota bacterium]|nr:MAG: hypothetical protein BMS9Abin37_1148 [Acidobacteriota bacterium]
MGIGSLGRYQVRGELGRGTMGIVYRGYDPVLDREIALKTVELPTALDPERRKRFLARFLVEAKIAGKLMHPNIVVTHDAATDESTETPFIAMELVSGESLHARLKRGRIEWEEALALVEPLAKALDYAHQADVVHRDIKPANILLTSKGVPKIADFGIAKLPNTQLTQSGTVMGTPYFMSPEQLQGEDVDGRSDVFSLGALLYNLLTGAPPFRGNDLASITQQVLYKSPTPPSELVEGIPVDVDGVLARAMAKKPEERYQSGEELASDLARVRQGDSPQKPASFGEKTQESTPRRVEPELRPPETASSSSGCSGFTFLSVCLAAALVAGAAFRWDDVIRFFEPLRAQQREGERREVVKTEASALLAEARDLLERGHFDRSRTFIEKALALSRDAKDGEGEAMALLGRGRLEAEQGAWSKARADLEASASVFAIYDHPEGRAKATIELADLERDLGNFDLAATLYDTAEPLIDATSGRAMLALMQGDLESAERGFESSGETVYAGAIAFASGDTELAQKRWSSHPSSPELALWRGYAILASGDTGEAEAAGDAQRFFAESAAAFRTSKHEPGLLAATEVDVPEESVLQTLFRAEPRTKRSEERRSRLP